MNLRQAGKRLISGVVIRETDDAVLVRFEDDEEHWIPRSVVLDGSDVEEGDEDIYVESWWLRNRGLI